MVVVVVRPIHGVCIIRNFRGDGGKSLSEKDGAREVAGVVRYIPTERKEEEENHLQPRKPLALVLSQVAIKTPRWER